MTPHRSCSNVLETLGQILMTDRCQVKYALLCTNMVCYVGLLVLSVFAALPIARKGSPGCVHFTCGHGLGDQGLLGVMAIDVTWHLTNMYNARFCANCANYLYQLLH